MAKSKEVRLLRVTAFHPGQRRKLYEKPTRVYDTLSAASAFINASRKLGKEIEIQEIVAPEWTVIHPKIWTCTLTYKTNYGTSEEVFTSMVSELEVRKRVEGWVKGREYWLTNYKLDFKEEEI